MNDQRARELLDAERRRVEALLRDTTEAFDQGSECCQRSRRHDGSRRTPQSPSSWTTL